MLLRRGGGVDDGVEDDDSDEDVVDASDGIGAIGTGLGRSVAAATEMGDDDDSCIVREWDGDTKLAESDVGVSGRCGTGEVT